MKQGTASHLIIPGEMPNDDRVPDHGRWPPVHDASVARDMSKIRSFFMALNGSPSSTSSESHTGD
jgi:hypothetical protein